MLCAGGIQPDGENVTRRSYWGLEPLAHVERAILRGSVRGAILTALKSVAVARRLSQSEKSQQ